MQRCTETGRCRPCCVSLPVLLRDVQENSHMERVPANAFRGLCSQTIRDL